MSPYSPSRYWAALHERGDLSAVGQSGLSNEMNSWLYRILRRNLDRFLRRNGAAHIAGAAFEVGAGTGYWFDVWHDLGAERVDGCDLVPAAVESLKARFGSLGSFEVADIAAEGALEDRTYGFVACMNVLLHVTDESKFDTALANVARLVAPGGRLLLTEPILFRPQFEMLYDPEDESRARPLARYREGLGAHGLELLAVAGATAVGNNPIEGRWRWVLAMWQASWLASSLPTRIHRVNSSWVGRVLYTIDPLLMAMGAAPSSKFALFQRPQT